MKILRKLILLICIAVFCYSAFMIGKYYYDGYQRQNAFKELKVETLAALSKKNKDTFGWIKIKNTKIDYPVMFTPDRPQHYLRKDFSGKYNEGGTIFLGDETDLERSKVWFIYGHNMHDGTMFGDLTKYSEKKDFVKDHPMIELETLRNGKEKYKVFAFAKTTALEDEAFSIYDYTNITDKFKFDKFIQGVKQHSDYKNDINPTFDDKLIVLSTCAYHTEEGRYYVVGVKEK
ncbi:MAG: class B sortase [Eubacteriales bacterium]|nr:class B sortase [Eubacteriales bacterium]MDY3332832.1 class B sortase [Gallibacter sp.]